MDIKLFDYDLPPERIGQKPVIPRDACRLLVVQNGAKPFLHARFSDITAFLRKGDVLVLNDTKVFPARLSATKETGGKIELFLLRDIGNGLWEVLLKNYKPTAGKYLSLGRGLSATVIEKKNEFWIVHFNKRGNAFDRIIDAIGKTPTPPYIKQPAKLSDYQTVYAKEKGSVAAPTAGFHFTKRLIAKLKKRGVEFVPVTLHVGLGTFASVTERNIRDHRMHYEHGSLSERSAKTLNKAKREGRRIIAVGTTSVRILEGFALANGTLKPGKKKIDLFIYPGYRFKMTDGLITNFHLPRSTLLMLVAGFIAQKDKTKGVPKKLLMAYREAIRKKYSFYSFGDAMLIL
jgi:S-adenosylmethionine:tRNA ribosyltransferase-isomerase